MEDRTKNCTIPRQKRSMIDGQSPSQTIMNCRIPKKKRIKIDGQPSSQLQSSQQSNHKSSPSSDAFRKKQYFNILNIQARSSAPSHGVGDLFIQLEGTTILYRIKLEKRCITSSDCIKGRTYLDSTSFSLATKKRTCPLVAFSRNGTNKYQRGYLLHLGVRKTVIIGLKPDNSFMKQLFEFHPMDSDKELSIIYINEVDETMDSQEDGYLCSKTTGPDYIGMDDLTEEWRERKIELDKKRLIDVTDLTNLHEEPTPTPFYSKSLAQTKKVFLIDENEEIPKTSDLGRKKNDWKDHYAFVSPDDKGMVYMLHTTKAKQLIKKEELNRQEFLKELKELCTFKIKCKELEIDRDKSLALTMNSTNTTNDGSKGKQLLEYEGDVLAYYNVQPPLGATDVQGVRFLFHSVLNGQSTERNCSDNVGLFFNKGITTSSRPKLDPRKDSESKMESERWNGKMNPTFAPLLFNLIEQLARYSTNASTAVDPVTTNASRKIYEDICGSEEGKEILKHNLRDSFGLSTLQIATFPTVDGTQFANTGHVDKNDLNVKAFHKRMTNRLSDELLKWSYKEHKQSRIEDKRKLYFRGLLHVLRMGMIEQEHPDDWSDLTTYHPTNAIHL